MQIMRVYLIPGLLLFNYFAKKQNIIFNIINLLMSHKHLYTSSIDTKWHFHIKHSTSKLTTTPFSLCKGLTFHAFYVGP